MYQENLLNINIYFELFSIQIALHSFNNDAVGPEALNYKSIIRGEIGSCSSLLEGRKQSISSLSSFDKHSIQASCCSGLLFRCVPAVQAYCSLQVCLTGVAVYRLSD
ncbi:uncharacterized protein [Spinacia oleracea]|uniref:Uncharacterized protein isoform X1 n=1 Tax=Spinacia oleracea TaxID=3562 RepID=A0ABM3RG30_SPIOL|nr:uncharacterized protein LOC130464260 [Spinacia oleracea]XP_056694570.1 uncharacterized protein LOC130469364 isoform X1 [Spinacia oleracea]